MNKMVWIAVLLAAVTARAGRLQLKDGIVYRNVVIISADPERMLIVHDGGGCQVSYESLKPDSLTPEQHDKVVELMKQHVARTERREQLLAEKEAFELAQQEKGLVLFEDLWITPAQREKIVLNREKARLERERLQVELAIKRAELETEQVQARRTSQEIDALYRSTRYITYSNCSSRYYPDRRERTIPNTYYGYVSRSRPEVVYGRRPGGMNVSIFTRPNLREPSRSSPSPPDDFRNSIFGGLGSGTK